MIWSKQTMGFRSILKSNDNLKKTQTLWDHFNKFIVKNPSFISGLTFVKWLKLALSNINFFF